MSRWRAYDVCILINAGMQRNRQQILINEGHEMFSIAITSKITHIMIKHWSESITTPGLSINII